MNSVCRSCGQRILWALTTEGKRMPLDAQVAMNGNLILDGEQVRYATPADTGPRYQSHFASCPDSGGWRKRRA
jgi:hypothetical protein